MGHGGTSGGGGCVGGGTGVIEEDIPKVLARDLPLTAREDASVTRVPHLWPRDKGWEAGKGVGGSVCRSLELGGGVDGEFREELKLTTLTFCENLRVLLHHTICTIQHA